VNTQACGPFWAVVGGSRNVFASDVAIYYCQWHNMY